MTAHQEVIRQVIAHIERDLDKTLDLEAIAQAAGYSKYHLNRLFAQETGCTIYKYLQARRLTVAAQKLWRPRCPSLRSLMMRGIIRSRPLRWPSASFISIPLNSTVSGAFLSPNRIRSSCGFRENAACFLKAGQHEYSTFCSRADQPR